MVFLCVNIPQAEKICEKNKQGATKNEKINF